MTTEKSDINSESQLCALYYCVWSYILSESMCACPTMISNSYHIMCTILAGCLQYSFEQFIKYPSWVFKKIIYPIYAAATYAASCSLAAPVTECVFTLPLLSHALSAVRYFYVIRTHTTRVRVISLCTSTYLPLRYRYMVHTHVLYLLQYVVHTAVGSPATSSCTYYFNEQRNYSCSWY